MTANILKAFCTTMTACQLDKFSRPAPAIRPCCVAESRDVGGRAFIAQEGCELFDPEALVRLRRRLVRPCRIPMTIATMALEQIAAAAALGGRGSRSSSTGWPAKSTIWLKL